MTVLDGRVELGELDRREETEILNGAEPSADQRQEVDGNLAIADGDTVDVFSEWPGEPDRVLRGYRAVAYPVAKGCAALYFPEGNVLVPRASVDPICNTPASKQVIVRLEQGAQRAQTGRPVSV